MKILCLALLLLLISCGETPKEEGDGIWRPYNKEGFIPPDDGIDDPEPVAPAETVVTPPEPTSLSFKGYVGGIFGIRVNDVDYEDMEDFYTQELAELPAKVAEAGYEGYDIRFNANVGFKDLWKGMDIYIAPVEKRGYQGKALVGSDGSFTVTLPPDATDNSYQIRANKRISVILRKETSVTLCYNFYAKEMSVSFADQEKPIVMTEFHSKVTAYSCGDGAISSGGVTIPAVQRVKEYTKLALGMSKAETQESLGDESLVVQSDTKWCWAGTTVPEVCAVSGLSSCQCSVGFDEDGLVIEQSNIKAVYLDLTTW